MIERYMKVPMGEIWSDRMHWEHCLQVELAWLKALVAAGKVPEEAYQALLKHGRIDVVRINQLEQKLGHDYNAFVDSLREQLRDAGVASYGDYIHQPLTTMDGQDPALILRLCEATAHVIGSLYDLSDVLWAKAKEHRWTICMGVTHNQDAEPTTLGVILCRYDAQIRRAIRHLEHVLHDDLADGKMSGPVGTYGGIDPALETAALGHLGLGVADDATQILQRDRHARLLAEIAIAGSVIEQMAKGLWMRMSSRVRELEEPRGKAKKDSSAMPHKKNPNLTEQLWGMARYLRADLSIALENIATFQDRDISQSSVEREIFPDATARLYYMAQRMTGIVTNMVVHSDRMADYVNKGSLGLWAGRLVRVALVEAGMADEAAYRYVQASAHRAVDTGVHLRHLLPDGPFSPDGKETIDLPAGRMAECFNTSAFIRHGVDYIFSRAEDAHLRLHRS